MGGWVGKRRRKEGGKEGRGVGVFVVYFSYDIIRILICISEVYR